MVWLFIKTCALYAWCAGWKFKGDVPPDIKKCVVIGAPHTSGWDFIIGMAGFNHYKYPFRYFGKQELFRFPLKHVLEKAGGIPVDRFRSNDLVSDTVKIFEREKEIFLVLSPEGTRAYVKTWRTGFYQIALAAKVPVIFAYLDFAKKEVGVGAPYWLTGNREDDFKVIRDFYSDVTPCHKEKWEPEFD